ncbi:hypothetical protein V6N12_054793 [Hibiscus sabdariffa]|uniref:Uncharacterized protein n=1 Tax=Hibiscus sabdariffa TaxID=183260 RepID=A0ABR2D1G5_9ROSI
MHGKQASLRVVHSKVGNGENNLMGKSQGTHNWLGSPPLPTQTTCSSGHSFQPQSSEPVPRCTAHQSAHLWMVAKLPRLKTVQPLLAVNFISVPLQYMPVALGICILVKLSNLEFCRWTHASFISSN